MNFYNDLKLYQKITLLIFLMVLLTSFSLYFGSNYIFRQTFEETVKKRISETLDVAHSIIEDYHNRAKSALGIISFNREFIEALSGEKVNYINDYLQVIQNNLLLSIIEVFSKNAKLITRVESKNLKNEKYHTSGANSLLLESISQLKKSCEIIYQNGVMQIKAIIPVVLPNSFEPNGAVVVTYPINHYFTDLLRCITNTDILIFNAGGEVVASAVINSEGHREINNFSFERENYAVRHSTLPAFIYGQRHQELYEKFCVARINGSPYGMGFSKIYDSSRQVVGIIACAIPLEKINEAGNKTANFLKIILLTVLILALIISFIFSRGLTGQLQVLTRRAQIVKTGNIDDFDIPVKSRDEIGILTDTFNQMSFSLKIMMSEIQTANQMLEQRLAEIKILYDISQSINFISDTHELLAKIIQKTVEAASAHHASIMLLNDETDELEVKLIQGIAPHKLGDGPSAASNFNSAGCFNNARLKTNLGIAGTVFNTGKPLIINDPQEDGRFYKNPDTSYSIDNMICVPLFSDSRPYGVINVVNKNEGRKFSETDLHVITSIANQISLILEKVKLYEQSITDGMTKLYIHRYFQARLDEEIIRARRYSKPLSLIMLDVDHFKSFNDTYGHQMGDVVLIGVAEVAKALIRSNIDIPARYGGEEFAIILPETDQDGAARLAERIRAEIAMKEFFHAGKKVNVTASFGIASYPLHSTSKLDLIARADIALYKSKENGRNRVSIFDPSDVKS